MDDYIIYRFFDSSYKGAIYVKLLICDYCNRKIELQIPSEVIVGEDITCSFCKNGKWKLSQAENFSQKGLLFLNENKIQEALVTADLALKISPNCQNAWGLAGDTYLRVGDFKNASVCFLEIIKLNDRHLEANHNLAIAYANLGLFKESEKYFEFAYRLNPNDMTALIDLANIKSMLGKSEKSLELYQSAYSNKDNCSKTEIILLFRNYVDECVKQNKHELLNKLIEEAKKYGINFNKSS